MNGLVRRGWFVREDDVFVVTKLDRLARSVANMLDIVAKLERKGVAAPDRLQAAFNMP